MGNDRLIQDLGNKNEIKRFRKYQVYRRDVVFGSPLYFAPYFTKRANQKEGEGICFLSKILGILSLKPKNIENFRDDLMKFSNHSKGLTEKWIDGVKTIYADTEKVFSFFFLDEPLKLSHPLKKDKTRKKGRGKDWIAAMIPKNRCVSFLEFARRIANSVDNI